MVAYTINSFCRYSGAGRPVPSISLHIIPTSLLTTTTLYHIQFKKHIYMLYNGSEWFAKVVRYFGCIITLVSLYKLKGLFLAIV